MAIIEWGKDLWEPRPRGDGTGGGTRALTQSPRGSAPTDWA